jgi:diguanylate cyclase (GGDEF)-like protein/PAS domain S-box-containing protein
VVNSTQFGPSRLEKLVGLAVGVVLLLGGVALAVVLTNLQTRVASSNAQAFRSLRVVSHVREIDALEWRAVAGQDIKLVTAQVDTAKREAFREIQGAHTTTESTELRVSLLSYFGAIDDELAALKTGNRKLAEEIEERSVDPAFDSVIQRASALAADQKGSAAQAEQSVNSLTWLIVLIAFGLFGGLFWIGLARLGRRQQTKREISMSRRFRSLVESSQSIVTVVTNDESLLLMSPTLGTLREFSQSEAPSNVSEMLPSDAFVKWRSVDELLRNSEGAQQHEFSLQRADGTPVWFEVTGAVLDGRLNERVWSWRDVTYRKELELQLTHQAFHDALTGAANRSLLRERADHALILSMRSGAPVSVLFCDLDDFKTVNDSLGHAHGDELLNIVTKRIAACVRQGDTVARLGGDEFAVLLEDADGDKALTLAERLLDVLSFEVSIGQRIFFPSASIGVATAHQGITTDELLRNADLAMYSAKRSGKGRAAVFQHQMHTVTTEELQLQTDLKSAVVDGELALHYQPSVSLSTGRVEAVEALVRWNHPTLGEVPPDRFVPLAEATGMIIAIGRWVLREACRTGVELGKWRASQRDSSHLESASPDFPIYMHVNLSPQQLLDPRIVGEVRQALSDSGFDPGLLVLEVTEGVLLNSESSVQRLHELCDLGVLVAIDDFGTGYTSISYLQKLPVRILKIDRSFVSGDALAADERRAFLHAILGLAKGLSFQTVAEGIEETSQLDDLRELGCDIGQGYLWARPAPFAETKATIRRIESSVRSTRRNPRFG